MTTPSDAAPDTRDTEQLDGDAILDRLRETRSAVEHAPEAARSEVIESQEFETKLLNLMDDRFRKKYFRWIIIGVGVLMTMGIIAGAIGFVQIAGLAASDTDQDAAIRRSEQLIQTLDEQARTANGMLESRGLPPISIPDNVLPGSPEYAQLITAATTATTLDRIAQIAPAIVDPIRTSPPQSPAPGPAPPTIVVPNDVSQDVARQIATSVASFMALNPVTVPQDQVFRQVSAYISQNPDTLRGPMGPTGAKGDPGPAVTIEQIEAAFRDVVQQNPNLLCPIGGSYGTRQVALAGGGSATQYGCFSGDSSAPAPNPDPGPEPSSGGSDEPTQAPPTSEPTQSDSGLLGG